jgi:hypothetical protein
MHVSNISTLVYRQIATRFKWIVLFLASLALIAEILPEIPAKMIVVPTLAVTIFYIIFNILRERKNVAVRGK